MSKPSPALLHKIAKARAAAPSELPLVRQCAQVVLAWATESGEQEAAIAGLGVGIAPWAFVAPDVMAGRLAAPFGFVERPSRFVFLRPEGRKDAAVDAFRDWLVAEGSRSPSPPIPWTNPGG